MGKIIVSRRERVRAFGTNGSNSAGDVVKMFGPCTTPDKAVPPPPSEAAVLTVPSARMQYPRYTRL
jgi:hypothetical protein